MSKTRVFEVARDLGLKNPELVARAASLGIQVRNHMSTLEPVEVDRIKRAIDKDKQHNVVEERIRPTVVRRRTVAKPGDADDGASAEEAAPQNTRPEVAPVAAEAQQGTAARGVQPKKRVAESVETPQPTAAPAAAAPAPAAPSPPVERESTIESARSSTRGADVLTVARRHVSAPSDQGENRPSQPPPASVRLGHTNLPPGVVARGGEVVAGARQLAPDVAARIVAQHAAQMRPSQAPAAPRRRELVRAAIGPTGRQQPGRRGKQRPVPGKKGMKTEITVPGAQKRVIRIEDEVQMQVLAQRMSLKATDVLMKLMQLGMTGVNINSTIDADTAKLLASEFGYEVENVAVSDDALVAEARGAFDSSESARTGRAPVVTVMGHVDHGKTSLLDKIRNANVAAGEAGGITQHLGAYRVETTRGPLVFLDTPGHAAFTAMRARGAQATDVVILVVAADDGVMPQTKEAVAHAKDAKVPIVVAINKMDRDDARPEPVMRELANLGLQPEDWGGDTIFVQVSALTGMGIEKLLDSVALQAEVLELNATHDAPAEGVVLEAYLDKGRGPVASLLVKNGTLKTGGIVVAGSAFGRVRAMSDDRGRTISEAGPSTPVEVLGLSAVPEAGDQFLVVTDSKIAQTLADRRKKPASRAPATTTAKVGLDQLFQKLQEGDVRELRLVIKSDMQGSAEALVKALLELSTDKVKVNVIHSGAGAITENDVMLAAASRAIIIGFHVRSSGGAAKIAKSERVEIRLYTIIYEAVDEVRKAMTGLLKPEFMERALGRAEVREVFTIPKIGAIAGSMVLDGKIQRGAKARLVRDAVQVWEGTIRSVRRFKEDVKEVGTGVECGIGLENFNDVKPQDVIECFELEQIAVTL